MGLFILILLIIGVCSFFISRAVYKSQVKKQYKNPWVNSSLVFILVFTLLAAGVFLLIINNIHISR